ncbi:uncharacterized protein M421DRAFT_223991 [Didymella exigua CBS 183.55]|uniref:Uncharacterized protein n=1 Tax=Didymella exigua CBS 183.55 TaxID=1150837 RepID=A0A6A5RCS0_9PLEO|nr:uncharacterized protein M421DRAFT_223991 [Didymella exigua CBS 183.55]KAF1926051.1 hypothetical protein M421DRAFT_223991 [Didymella exigua CBS 183.55]
MMSVFPELSPTVVLPEPPATILHQLLLHDLYLRNNVLRLHIVSYLSTLKSCWASTACITSQSGIHAIMIIGGLRNGVRKPTVSGLKSGRLAGFDVARQPTNPQLRDRETLRRRDSDEVSVAQSPSEVTRLPIMTPEARKHHFKPPIIPT